jgi:long-chain acyl-CoA synthetase
MNQTAENWPAMTLAQAEARLTAPGQLFEIAEVSVRGIPTRVWKNVPATARAVFELARRHGAAEFLVHEDERISFDAFAHAALVLAATLQREGLKKGDRVALVMRNLPEWPMIFFGALIAGAIVVPLNAWWTGPELAYGLKDSGSRFVFADAERAERLQGHLPPDVEQVFVARGEPASALRALEDILGPPHAWHTLPDGVMPAVPQEPEDNATIFYTSGTTGTPKGALGTHRSLTTNIFATPFSLARNALRRGVMPADPRTAPQRVILVTVPFFHVTACMAALMPNAASGGKLILMRKFEPETAMALIQRERVSLAGGVPAIPLSLLEHPRFGDYDLSSLELLAYGGAPSPAGLAGRIRGNFPNAAPGNGWGMTETSATCTTHSAEDFDRRPASCGPALPVSRIKIMARDGSHELPHGEVGELWASGPNLVRGYWERPADTAEVFRDGWLRTGDLAFMDDEGFCFIVDRARDMLIRGGENIYCIEVESVLCEHPAIADAALIGLPHPTLGEVPAAVVQVRAAVSEDDLRRFAATRLAPFKVPEKILMLQAPLPRNANGKVVKSELKMAFAV